MAWIYNYMLIALIGITASVMGMFVNDKPTATANEFLISNWKIWYKVLDVNHDGIVSMEDAEESRKKFSTLEHLDTHKAKIVTEVFTKYWDECIFLGGKGDIPEHEFVDTLESYFNTNAEEYVKERRRCVELILSATDVNKDKSLSKKELQTFHTAFGHSKLANDDDYFSAYGSNDSFVPLCEVVDNLVDFTTNTNKSKGNIILSRLDIDGFE